MATEAAAYHGPRFARRPEDYPAEITELIRTGLNTQATVYQQALSHRARSSQTHYDLASPFPLITPATVDVACALTSTGDPAFSSPWSFLGYPTISVPVAWSADGLPVAVQLIGGQLGEIEVFAHAAYLERTAGFERRPLPL
jgi:aspartyl-tRNA(Asn)/glutamyl-tRNA(Gln) amidotransferase subunit A